MEKYPQMDYAVGDMIEHNLTPPGFWPMRILETRECENDFARPKAHLAYKVIDWEGNEDWLCAYDARLVGRAE